MGHAEINTTTNSIRQRVIHTLQKVQLIIEVLTAGVEMISDVNMTPNSDLP